jgi:predicted short-subunit dehydrogenase-like oxidoreductase (DUF2520 family)
MFQSVRVIGHGRVGTAIEERLRQRGRDVRDAATPDLVLLCVPDAAIAEVAATVPPGPWIAHTSGATPVATLAPHSRRFSIHPLQTFTRRRGAEQLDGAWAAVFGESRDATDAGIWLAAELGLTPFEMSEQHRVLYHAGAVIASNYLVTLYRAAGRALVAAGAPPDALLPLMRRTIENGFELTGPIARGDWATVAAHLQALKHDLPELEPMYRALADITVP